jgi:hypothetical protein
MKLYGKSSAPPAPDYTAAANATAAGNLEAARFATTANRSNQYTPYGSLEWQDLGNDKWSQRINLTDSGQKLLDQDQKTSQNLANLQDTASGRVAAQQGRGWNDAGLAGSASSFGGPVGGSVYAPGQATNDATNQIMARVNPQLQRSRNSAEVRLANQGVQQGSEAWKNAQTDIGQQENDAYSQAALQGISLGQGQQAQTYGQQMQNNAQGMQGQAQTYAQQNQLRQQGLQEQQYFGSRDMNQLNALRTGSQVNNPTFSNYAQQQTTAGPDLLGAANSQYGAALDASNAQNAASGGLMSGLFSLGGAALGGPAGGVASKLFGL